MTINDFLNEMIFPVLSQFGNDPDTGAHRSLWIGLKKNAGESEFKWVSGETSGVTSWLAGYPKAAVGDEAFAMIVKPTPGLTDDPTTWVDSPSPITDSRFGPAYGVVEVPLSTTPPDPPVISSHPVADVTRVSGGWITLSAAATGPAPLSYQWHKDGSPVSAATSATWTKFGLTTSDSGVYHVTVSNAGGSVTSSNSVVTVNPRVSISVQPQNLTVIHGQSVSLGATPHGAQASGYQWFFKGEPLTGSTNATHLIAEASASHAGQYHVQASFPNFTAVSDVVTLVVYAPTVRYGGTNLSPRFVPAGIQPPGGLSSVKVDWLSQEGGKYWVEYANDIKGPWGLLGNQTYSSTGVLSSVQLPLVGKQTGFTRIRQADTEAPTFGFIFPITNGFAVASNAILRVAIYDESQLDISRITLRTAEGEAVSLDDSRFTFTNNVASFDPGTNSHGRAGQTVIYHISAVDEWGNASGEIQWPFTIAQDVVLADGAVGVGSSADGTAIQQVSLSSIKLTYPGSAHGFTTNQVIWSNDPQNPFYRRITGIADDTNSSTVTLQTFSVPLNEVVRQGGLSISRLTEVPSGLQPSGFVDDFINGTHSAGHTISISDSFDETFDLGGPVTLQETVTWNLSFDLAASVQINGGELQRARFALTPSFTHTMSETLSVSVSTNFGRSKILYEDDRLYYAGQIGPVPVWIQLEEALTAGYSVRASASGSIGRSAQLKVSSLWEATYDAGRDLTNRWHFSRERLPTKTSYQPLQWQIEGNLFAQAYLTPSISVELLSLAGVEGSLTPSLHFDAKFQANPLEYEWKLYKKLDAAIKPSIEFWTTNFGELPTWNIPVASNYITGEKHPEGITITSLKGLPQTNDQGILTGEISEATEFSIQVIDTAFAIENVEYQWYRGNVLQPIAGSVFSAKGHPGLVGQYRVVAIQGTNSDMRRFELTLKPDSTPPEMLSVRALSTIRPGISTLRTGYHVEAEDPESGIKEIALIGYPTKLPDRAIRFMEESITNVIASDDQYWIATDNGKLAAMTGHLDTFGNVNPGPPSSVAMGETFELISFARNNRGLMSKNLANNYAEATTAIRFVQPLDVTFRDTPGHDILNRPETRTNGIMTIPGICEVHVPNRYPNAKKIKIDGAFDVVCKLKREISYDHSAFTSWNTIQFGEERFGPTGDTASPKTSDSSTSLIYLDFAYENIDFVYIIRSSDYW